MAVSMEGEMVETFERACADLGVSTSRCSREGVSDAVAEAIETPAVATLDDVSDVQSIQGVTVDPTRAEFEQAVTGLTSAVLGVATSGSLLLESTSEGSELLSLYPQRHVALLEIENIVSDLESAFGGMEPILADGGDVVLATGPSATADMGDLVIGAHGPRDVHVILVGEADE